ncbi:TPA: hypothetical protein HA278_01400 [Candidatus Woesearchaeota archaeon]|nr:hypothetical protein [archaeon]HIJ10689.1 hypothetical protein [Candidatus Woesearchaeota archaeon]|tara:strand:+ start:33 stop:512 length:480 start_codon:yes stop_codon:yes gene_type:complete
MNKDIGKLLTAFLAVLFGVFGLIKFVQDVELVIGLLSLTFGLVAIMWTYRAMASLSKGTSLRDYAFYFLLSLIFIILFSIWDTAILLFQLQGSFVYPKYFLITIAYLIFSFTSYKILQLGKQFGFHFQVNKMSAIKENKKGIKKTTKKSSTKKKTTSRK